MLKEETLEILKKQREEKFEFINIDKQDLTKELLANIGAEDGELRDGLIYPCLAHLLHDKHFDKKTLIEFLDVLTDEEHLFYDIKNDAKNSVLTRSFSSLQIVILLFVHKRDKVLPITKVKEVLDTYITYFEKEKHFEGYNDTVGWLHSIAHAADVFDQFVTIEEFKEEELKRIFEAILEKFKQRNYYFQHDEDERMVVGITKAIKRNILTEEYLFDWIERVSIYEKNGKYPEMYIITKNVKNLLRSLYFTLLDEKEFENIIQKIKEVLKQNVTLR